VEAVAFSVPPHVQAPLALRAAEAGKHLLLEKPVALSLDDADRLVKAVEAANVASVVFFTHRFNPEIRAWLTDENARGGWSGGGWSGGVAVWLGDALEPDSPFNTPWRREKGGLWDLGPHVVSMLWACLGPVTSASATSGGDDVTHMMLWHESGATSTATMTLNAPPAAAGNSLFVWGEAGRSVMPATLVDAPASLGVAVSELTDLAAAGGRPSHPCDVRFGREVVRVLTAAQARRDQRSLLDAGLLLGSTL
jgi:predicted dehydrogenase